MQVGLCHVEFVPAREPIEYRHVHREKRAKGRPGAAEVVRFGDADLQVRFGKVRVQRDLWIILGADPGESHIPLNERWPALQPDPAFAPKLS